MRGCLGWFLLMPIVGAFLLTITVGNACARRETAAWRMVGVISSSLIGGTCAYLGWMFGPKDGLVIGWIALIVGVLMALAGIWTSLVATRQSIELNEEIERQKKKHEDEISNWTISEAKRMIAQSNISDYGKYEIIIRNLSKMHEIELQYDLENLAKKQRKREKHSG